MKTIFPHKNQTVKLKSYFKNVSKRLRMRGVFTVNGNTKTQ